MEIDGMSFEEFIEIFDEYFQNFILRVRDSKQDYNKSNDKECLVYYSGIEAFTVIEYKKDGKKGIKLDFPINVYKLNPTGLRNASKKSNDEEVLIDEQIEDFEEGQTREQKEAKYRIGVGNICDAMHKLFDFEMDKITFNINFSENKKIDKDKIINNFYKLIVHEFAQLTNSHNRDKNTKNLTNNSIFKITNNKNNNIIDSISSKAECYDICQEFSDQVEFTLKFTPKLTTRDEERNSTPKDIIALQCWFLRKARDMGVTSGVEFTVNSYYRGRYDTEKSLQRFSENTKNAIEKYKFTSCRKLEKSYQHFFMLRAHEMNDLFEIQKDEKIDYFEQEYGIYNPKVYGSEHFKKDKKTDKTGRIDCIVYKYKLDGKKRLISDLYMIELKVNCDVILGDNGVMTHLEDICAFLNYEGNVKYRYSTLEKRINDRIKILSGGKEEARFENVAKHFYTVIGYTNENESEKEIIMGMLKKLNDKDTVDEMIKCGYPKTVDGKTKKFYLNKRFKGITLRDLKQNINKCDIKFFLEKNIFNEKNIGVDFDDITKELF